MAERSPARPRPPRPAPPPTLNTAARSGRDTVPGLEQTTQSPEELYKQIKTIHDEAFLYIEQGLYCDERGQGEQAVVLYKKGLVLVKMVTDTNLPTNDNIQDEDLTNAKRLLDKMKRSQLQIQSRIDELGSKADVARALNDPPPSYEQATSPNGSMSDVDLTEWGDELFEDNELPTPEGAVQLYTIAEGVQIFYINPEGNVSAPSYPSGLKIFRFQEPSADDQLPPAYLQVGEWRYPLLPGGSPALYTDSGAYVFPDVLAEHPGSSVGVILPQDITNDERQHFLHLLSALTTMWGEDGNQLRPSTPEQESGCFSSAASRSLGNDTRTPYEERTSTKISKGLVTAAEWISWGLEKGAEKTGELLKKGSAKLKDKIHPEDEPSKIDPRVQEGMKYVRKASHTAVEVSSFVVTKLGQATMAVGRKVAPHIKKQGEKLLPESWRKTDNVDGKSKLDGALEIASGGLQGFGTIFMSLETAARALARSIATETVRIINHKYGAAAGNVADQTLFSAGNVAMAARNVNCLGIKAIAKRAAKDTGRVLITDGASSNDKTGEKESGQTPTPPSRTSPQESPTRARLCDLAQESRRTPNTSPTHNIYPPVPSTAPGTM